MVSKTQYLPLYNYKVARIGFYSPLSLVLRLKVFFNNADCNPTTMTTEIDGCLNSFNVQSLEINIPALIFITGYLCQHSASPPFHCLGASELTALKNFESEHLRPPEEYQGVHTKYIYQNPILQDKKFQQYILFQNVPYQVKM